MQNNFSLFIYEGKNGLPIRKAALGKKNTSANFKNYRIIELEPSIQQQGPVLL